MLAAPGVVVAIVVDRPTSTLEGVLAALVAQDYPSIQVLVLLTGSDADEFALVNLAPTPDLGQRQILPCASSKVTAAFSW